ncbi:MAG: F0F1 ATP synthase subunit alpha [Oscillospiraceae bacterium]|nr:F0F1 ATP synthase subunit alpha [Oscillospiraceae bacterium]
MELVYALINFALLAGGVWLVFRKPAHRMLQQRREEIVRELAESAAAPEKAQELRREAEETAAASSRRQAELKEASRHAVEEAAADAARRCRAETDAVLQQAEEGKAQLRRQLRSSTLHRQVEETTRRAATLLQSEEYASRRAALHARALEQIGQALTFLPGDVLSARRAGTLAGEAASVEPVTDGERAALESAVRRCWAETAGSEELPLSLTWRRDESLLGGVRLTLGDTVYDDTVAHRLERLCQASRSADRAVGEDGEEDLRRCLAELPQELDVYQVGRVISLSDGICHVSGLAGALSGEMLVFEDGLLGMVMDLEPDSVGVVLLGDYAALQEGDAVRRTGRIIQVPVGEALIGRVVDALGRPLDGKGAVVTSASRPIESPAPGVPDRQSVGVPLQTGIKAIDALVPIGRGQRELIIGDRQTGKTAIALDAILNQKGTGVLCVYVAVGQKESTVAGVVKKLEEHGALAYTTVVCAAASEPAPMLYIAPYAGTAIGEEFMYAGRDVLIVYDDLSKQAAAYREISLLLHRPPGREAYPGDVFYLHSRLLERSARLSDELGGGSMTALPIIETQAGDISAYIPTNVISITDGQIFLETGLFHAGVRPAVNVGLSVSRVGGAAQIGAMKQVASRLRMDLAQYRELAAFSQFGSDLDAATRSALDRGVRMTALLKQDQYAPVDAADQVVAIYAAAEGFADALPVEELPRFEREVTAYVRAHARQVYDAIRSGAKLSAEQLSQLHDAVEACCASLAASA